MILFKDWSLKIILRIYSSLIFNMDTFMVSRFCSIAVFHHHKAATHVQAAEQVNIKAVAVLSGKGGIQPLSC